MPSVPLTIHPARPGLSADWRVPGSKSITNRALLLAALAEGTSVLDNVLEADDTTHMRRCLAAMGVDCVDAPDRQLLVHGGRSRLRAAGGELFVGNSGTTVRFLAALCALVPGEHRLVGDAAMAKRPIQDLIDGLAQAGVAVDCPTGCPPLTIRGGSFAGGAIRMRGDRSSQYFSAIMLVAGLAGAETRIAVEGTLVSRPYVEMTRRMVADFGGAIDDDGAGGFIVRRTAGYRCRGYAIEPDASAASYPFALAAAGAHAIRVPGLDRRSLQGDIAVLDLLARMGAEVASAGGATTVRGSGRLDGIEADMHHISDTVMTIAAIAPLARGATVIRNVANIRLKETDRLLATVTELRRLGQQVEHGEDWLRIEPRPLRPATIDCYHDHRMAMSFGVLGSIVPGITIADPGCVAKTYPGFWADRAACTAG